MIKGRMNKKRGSAAGWSKKMADEYGADLVTVMDDEGHEHQFELVDAIETDDGRYGRPPSRL